MSRARREGKVMRFRIELARLERDESRCAYCAHEQAMGPVTGRVSELRRPFSRQCSRHEFERMLLWRAG
jgi:hypothetical protein